MNTLPFVYGLAVITSIAAIVLAYIFILPEKKREKLPKILKFVHDIFNFKTLFLEIILKFIYVMSTIACVVFGVLMIFGFRYINYGFGYSRTFWYGGYGLLLAIVGPIVIRLIFESTMMFILLVKNTIEINKKLKNNVPESQSTPVYPNAQNYADPYANYNYTNNNYTDNNYNQNPYNYQ